MRYKYLISAYTDACRNLALEQALFCCATNGTAILFLWQNDNTIVVGKNQDLYSECKAAEFLSQGGHIARRRSGGGAVYHDLGNLNFSIICKPSEADMVPYRELISETVRNIGITAQFNGRNDLIADGRKFSGNAVYSDTDIVCQHGTVLVSSNLQKMSYYLTPDKEKLNRNHVGSVSARVVNLNEIKLGTTVEMVKQSFIETTGAESLNSYITAEILNSKMFRIAEEFYASEAWIYGGRRGRI